MVFPYLNFDGCCEEAFQFYEKAFHGKNMYMSKYGEFAPSPEAKDLVMHVEMDLDDFGRIAGGDAMIPYEKGISVHTIIRTSEEKLRRSWAILEEEGTVISNLESFAPEGGALIGTIQDKFGFVWIFTQE